MKDSSVKLLNVLLMSWAFLFLFASYFAMGNLQTVIIEAAKNENSSGHVEGFNGDGFASLAVVYGTSSLSNWVAPSILAVLGAKYNMVVGSLSYPLFMATFYHLTAPLLYAGSVLLGFGAAILWVGQGETLAANSTPETVARNTGIFWAFLQGAGVVGNTFAFFQFRDSHDIEPEDRTMFVTVLLAIATLGTGILLALKPVPRPTSKAPPPTPLQALRTTFNLLFTPRMALLVVYFTHVGMAFTFWGGVYGPCLGFTMVFDNPKSLPGLHGIMVCLGNTATGLFFMVFGPKISKTWGKYPIVLFGSCLLICSYAVIFINIPNEAPLGETYDTAILYPSNEYLAILCSFFLGVADGCYGTQTMSILAGVYAKEAGPAFAIYKFIKHTSAAIGFAYAGFMPLYWHVALLSCTAVLGTACFTMVDLQFKKAQRSQEEEETTSQRINSEVKKP